MKRLYVLLSVFCICAVAIAQHPHSRGGSPFYWALVGGISAILMYSFYWGGSFILTLFRRNRNKSSDENVNESHLEESKTKETDNNDTTDNNDEVSILPNEAMEINAKGFSLSQSIPYTRTKKQKIITLIIGVIMSLLSVIVVELYISNKQDTLFSGMLEQVRNSFNSDDAYSPGVEAIFSENIDDLEYKEVPIPAFPNEGDKHEKKHWMNMFMGVEHLYKITDGGWTIIGDIYHPVPYQDGSYRYGVQEYLYIPYMICVPEGADFNVHIAKSIVNKALDKVYTEPTEAKAVHNANSYTNDYYEINGRFYGDSVPEISIPFYNKSTGTEPIFENGKFTGYYRYGMLTIGQYRVLLAYRNRLAWNVVEKRGFNASVKDRVLFYGIAFALILFIIVLYLSRDRIKLKSKRMFRIEKTDKQMYCRHCGKLIDADSNYCRYCGKKL